MDLIGWYVLFAVTTSLAFIYEVLAPTMAQLALTHPEDNMIQNKYLSYFVYFLLGCLVAPLLLLPCLVPSLGNRFRISLYNVLTKG